MHETNIREDYTSPVIVSNNGENVTVMMSVADYNLYREFLHEQYILRELEKSEIEAADPNTKRLTEEEVMGKFRKEFGYEYEV